jgi:hypothetical protein
MKITNISSASSPVSVSFKKGSGEFAEVLLSKGEFIYTDSPEETKSIVIQWRKGNIETMQEEKPSDMEYYVVYGTDNIVVDSVVDDNIVIKSNKVETTHIILQQESGDEEEVIETPSDEAKPNKGGRPKGAKNKPKRGRPKVKRPPGRPRKNPIDKKEQPEVYTNRVLTEKSIGEELDLSKLIGMSKNKVQDICTERGFSIRVTSEDGNPYIITHDFRIDRVNLSIENGIVVKANFG